MGPIGPCLVMIVGAPLLRLLGTFWLPQPRGPLAFWLAGPLELPTNWSPALGNMRLWPNWAQASLLGPSAAWLRPSSGRVPPGTLLPPLGPAWACIYVM